MEIMNYPSQHFEKSMLISIVNSEKDWESQEIHLPFTYSFKNLLFFFYVRKFFDDHPHTQYNIIMDLESNRCKKLIESVEQKDLIKEFLKFSSEESWNKITGGQSCESTLLSLYYELQGILPFKSWEEATGEYCIFCLETQVPCDGRHQISEFVLTTLILPEVWVPFGKDILLFPLRKTKTNLLCEEYCTSKGFLLNLTTGMLWEVSVHGKVIQEPVRKDVFYRVVTDFLTTYHLLPHPNLSSIALQTLFQNKDITELRKEEVTGPVRGKIKQIYKVAFAFNWCCKWSNKFHCCTRGVRARNLLGIPCEYFKDCAQSCGVPRHKGHFHSKDHPSTKNFWFKDTLEQTHVAFMDNFDQWEIEEALMYRQELIHTYQEMMKNPLQHPSVDLVEKHSEVVEDAIYSYEGAQDGDFQMPEVGQHQPVEVPLHMDAVLPNLDGDSEDEETG